jgi:hypothetical protein
MYWADLSRLSGSMPRIVSELFTLVFRLSKLGRETVDEMWGQLARARDKEAPGARRYSAAWNVVAWLQIGLDWMFVNGLALLFAQLALLGVLLAVLGFTSGLAPSGTADLLHYGVAIALLVVSALRLLYCAGGRLWLQLILPLAVLVGTGVALTHGTAWLQWVTALALLGGLTLANEFVLRIADDRFPLVHFTGSLLWACAALLMLGSAIHETPSSGPTPWREVWVHAALFTSETALLAIKWWWIVVGPLLLVWLIAGEIARTESGYASRASVATGRLGVTVSMGMFLILTMTTWALINGVLGKSVEGTGYRPCIFAFAPSAGSPAAKEPPPPASAVINACMWQSGNAKDAVARPQMPAASAVLYDRYEKSTSTFSLLATLLLMLVAYLLAMFTPSVLAELKLVVDAKRDANKEKLNAEKLDATDLRQRQGVLRQRTQRTQRARALGRWLTQGYRHLDLSVALVSLVGVALSLVIAALFLLTVFKQDSVSSGLDAVHLGWLMGSLTDLESGVSRWSQTLFAPLQAAVFSAAGVGATLSVLGGALSRRIPALRAPLDVAMDVDNHFREFPRTDIPRAHIFSRYAALLEHVRAQGYDRIVVVSHSQGTVISSELLRFLSSRDQFAPEPGQTPQLAGQPLPPINLLTLGCPLRQLYGARFPGLYAWVLAKNGDMFGPRADDIGVQRWMNGFCSGDYVGRWLWSHAGDEPTLPHPMVSTLEDDDTFGRVDAYAGFEPMPPLDAVLDPAREAEVCLGLGAHTHYFERDQTTVAWMIDYLVSALPPRDPLGGGPVPTGAAPGPVPTLAAAAGQAPRVVPVEASVVSDGRPAPAAAPDTTAPPPVSPPST